MKLALLLIGIVLFVVSIILTYSKICSSKTKFMVFNGLAALGFFLAAIFGFLFAKETYFEDSKLYASLSVLSGLFSLLGLWVFAIGRFFPNAKITKSIGLAIFFVGAVLFLAFAVTLSFYVMQNGYDLNLSSSSN